MVHDYPATAQLAGSPTLQDLRALAVGPARESIESLNSVYVFGAGGTGMRVRAACEAAGLDVLGFVDNSEEKRCGGWAGSPVVAPVEAVESGAGIIVASVLYFNEMQDQLRGLGASKVVFYPRMTAFDPVRFPAEPVFSDLQEDLANHRDEYLALFDKLQDPASRAVFDAVLQFRLTLDGSHLQRSFSSDHRHYFPPELICLGDDEVFVDGGGYDGDTSSDFVETSHGKYRRIYLFEPDPHLLARARRRLASEGGRVRFVDRAVYSEETTLHFRPEGISGRLDEAGELSVRTATLDSALEEPASYIKLDIEGAERHAIRGATGQIGEHRPRLALSVYHSPDDLWRLPHLVSGIRDDYRMYMRHYSTSVADTVVYCL
jgi:FkbM family methyltransferase